MRVINNILYKRPIIKPRIRTCSPIMNDANLFTGFDIGIPLNIFQNSSEKNILKNLTTFSLERNF